MARLGAQGVHAKKGVQAIIAATTFNKLQETATKRQTQANTGGAYWRAMERLATETCALPDVACVTYSTAMRMLQDNAEDGGA